MTPDEELREHVLYLLRGGGAHIDLETALAGLPVELRGAKPEGIPHTPWRLLEHMRLCQWDIVEYCRKKSHVSPSFPDGYWPDGDGPPTSEAWDESITKFRADQQQMVNLIMEPTVDMMAQIPHGEPGHTVLREALLIADHNAYHVGQLVVVRRGLGAWHED